MDYNDGRFYALCKNNEYSWMEFILELRVMQSKVDLHYFMKILTIWKPFMNVTWINVNVMNLVTN